jgi:tetratricopeptide (TPR) repeat protein
MTDTSEPSKSQTQRVVRVFVSSTFRDMHGERDYLATHVFPDLRDRCRKRQVEFVAVDLRWGITEEQSQRGEVLPICLREIENCRPYFIGLLGDRYGWIPDSIHPELISMQGWLEEHKEKSVTELEILHGVLNNPAMADRSFFYFRDPAYIETIPEAQRSDFVAEDAASKGRLEKLKGRIRDSGLQTKENYADPKAAGELIRTDLWAAIDASFPEIDIPNPLDQEIADHEAFAQSRAKIYIKREQDFKRLDAHVQGEGPPLVLIGESGVGKSALIANWAIRYREAYPEDFMILHFIGSSPASADYVGILRRIMAEIKRRHDVPDEIPVTPEKLREAFPLWLASASARGRLILVLDGLNQLEDRDNAPHLGWLPDHLAPNVRVLVSTLPGSSLEAVQKRNWPQYEVKSLDQQERLTLIVEYLARSSRQLSNEHLDRIVNAEQTSNPLYLKVLLDELGVFGLHEQLGARIEHFLEAQTIPNLYEKVLERLEEDYEEDRPELVKDAMSFLWASRRGLYESELLELLGDSDRPIPRAIWSPLNLAIEESLLSRGGLLNFFHNYLRMAVTKRYLADTEVQKAHHIQLADYFEKRETDERKADELPWQLCQAKEWARLKDIVTNIPIFLILSGETERYVLTGYWLALSEFYDMVAEYHDSLESFESSRPSDEALAISLNQVAIFLNVNSRHAGAEPLCRRALAIREKALGTEHSDTAASVNNLAELLRAKGDHDGAEPLHRRALEIWEKVLGPEHPNTGTSLHNLAMVLEAKGDYDAAEPLCRRALEISEKVLGPEHPDTAGSVMNLAMLLRAKGDYDAAEPLCRRALEIWEKVLGPEHPNTALSLNNLAALLYAKGDYDGAEALSRRALEISEKALGPQHPNTGTSLNTLAMVLKAKEDYDGAERLYRKALAISEKVLGPEHPNTALSLNNLAALLYAKGDYDGAEALSRRALEISEKALGPQHPSTGTSLNNLAMLLKAKGDYRGAEALSRRALAISEKVLGPEHPATAGSVMNLAGLLRANRDYGGAERLYRRALAIREKVLGPEHLDTAESLNNLALLLDDKGDYDGAEPLYRRALATLEKVLGPEHPNTGTSLHNLGTLLYAKGDHDNAEPLCRRALAIREKILGPEHLATSESLNNLATVLEAKGDYAGAEPLSRRALAISEKVLGPEHPNTALSLNNLAGLLLKKGDYDAAEPVLARLLKVVERLQGHGHPETVQVRSILEQVRQVIRQRR